MSPDLIGQYFYKLVDSQIRWDGTPYKRLSCISISKHLQQMTSRSSEQRGFSNDIQTGIDYFAIQFTDRSNVYCLSQPWIQKCLEIDILNMPAPPSQRGLFPAFLFDSFPLPVKEMAWNSLQLERHHYCPRLEHYLRLTNFFNGFPFRYYI